MIIIDFLDYNVIDTLILTKTLKPSRLVLMGDSDEIDSRRARHLVNAIKQISPSTGVELRKVDTADIPDAVKAVEEISNRVAGTAHNDSGREVCLNIDADHGISTAAGYGAGDSNRAIPICVDMKHGVIRNLKTLEEMAAIKHITLQDFLSAIGAKQVADSHELPPESEYPQIVAMAEVLFRNVFVWNKLCAYIGKHYSHDTMQVRIPADLGGEASERNVAIVREMLQAFCDNGFLRRSGDDRYVFTSGRHKGYMVVFGIWLEMYIYIKFKPYFEEIHCGYVIDWDSMDDYDTKDNEIDVIGIYQSRPVLISCKMRMPTKEDIYEIGYIAEMLGGSHAIPAIATTAIVNHRKTYKPGLYPRFRKMNVGLIETIRLRKEGVPEELLGNSIRK